MPTKINQHRSTENREPQIRQRVQQNHLSTLQKVAVLSMCIFLAAEMNNLFHQGIAVMGVAGALQIFEPSIARGMHPGYYTNDRGNIYCKFTPKPQKAPLNLDKIKDCDRVADIVETYIHSQHPEIGILYPQYVSENTKGLAVEFDAPLKPPTNIERITIKNNPQKYKNYQEALYYLENNVLKNENFFKRPSEIVKAIKKTHEIAMRNLMDFEGPPGKFRREALIVLGDDVEKTHEGFIKELLKSGGTQEEVEIYKESMKMLIEGAVLSDRELNVMKKIGHIPTNFKDIPEEMETFANELKDRVHLMKDKQADPIETGAWVHQSIGTIHPFTDGNGRVARAWMNCILEIGGVKAVIFPDDDTYTQAVRDDQNSPGLFTHFLRETIEWNQNKQLLDL